MKRIILLLFSLNIYANAPIRVAISSAPSNLSPFFSTDANSQNINKLIHQSLVEMNVEMKYVCQLCESYSESVKDGKHIFNFLIKENQKYQDGSVANAQDVVNSWIRYAQDEKINSTFKGAFESIESVKALSPRQVEIIFKKFSLENLGNLNVLKVLKLKEGKSDYLDVQNLQGLGEYTLNKVDPLEIQLKSRTSKRSDLIFKVVKDETTLALKLLNNEIDLSVASMGPRKVQWLQKNSNLKIWQGPGGNYVYLSLNNASSSLKSAEMRKAIWGLVPREELLRFKLKGMGQISNGLYSPAFNDLYLGQKEEGYLGTDIDRAIRLAGWSKNAQGVFEKAGKQLELNWIVSNNKSSIEVAEYLKYCFEKNGIKINQSIQEWGTYMSSFKKGKYDILIGQWVGFSGMDMLRFIYHSENKPPKGGNRMSFFSPEFDRWIDQAVTEPVYEKRIQYFREAQKVISEKIPSLSLWHPNNIWISRQCIKNVVIPTAGNYNSFKEIINECQQ